MNREQMIELLVNQDIEEMLSAALDDNYEVIAYTLELGFKGYTNYTDAELVAEITERESMAILLTTA
jgi:hypothetical protein